MLDRKLSCLSDSFAFNLERLIFPEFNCRHCSSVNFTEGYINEWNQYVFSCQSCLKNFCYCVPISCSFSPSCVSCRSLRVKAYRMRERSFYWRCLDCKKDFVFSSSLTTKSHIRKPFLVPQAVGISNSFAHRLYFPRTSPNNLNR